MTCDFAWQNNALAVDPHFLITPSFAGRNGDGQVKNARLNASIATCFIARSTLLSVSCGV